jgi:hypothetical protein
VTPRERHDMVYIIGVALAVLIVCGIAFAASRIWG